MEQLEELLLDLPEITKGFLGDGKGAQVNQGAKELQIGIGISRAFEGREFKAGLHSVKIDGWTMQRAGEIREGMKRSGRCLDWAGHTGSVSAAGLKAIGFELGGGNTKGAQQRDARGTDTTEIVRRRYDYGVFAGSMTGGRGWPSHSDMGWESPH
jgi:hypothetical protein